MVLGAGDSLCWHGYVSSAKCIGERTHTHSTLSTLSNSSFSPLRLSKPHHFRPSPSLRTLSFYPFNLPLTGFADYLPRRLLLLHFPRVTFQPIPPPLHPTTDLFSPFMFRQIFLLHHYISSFPNRLARENNSTLASPALSVFSRIYLGSPDEG